MITFIDGFEKLVTKILVGNLVNFFFERELNGEFSSIFFRSEFIFNIGIFYINISNMKSDFELKIKSGCDSYGIDEGKRVTYGNPS